MTQAAPDNLPTSLAPLWEQTAARLDKLSEVLAAARPEVRESAGRVAVCSDFVLATLERYPQALVERLANSETLTTAGAAARFDIRECGEAEAMRSLRRARQVEMARIAWRDLAGWVDLETSLLELSVLADGAVLAACDYAVSALEKRFGRPVDDAGNALPLLVLGMGKLGGYELNYSSDIDLVFLHPDSVECRGIEGIDREGYYRRVAQLVVKLLDEVTSDGFVFRVDTRLRPFGKSGPLSVGISALETYLVRHGRDWERYAYLKARLLNGAEYEDEVFAQILTPFVYRRYVDFGVFAALRQMKALIKQEVARKDMAENIKLGPGGIREIEFIAQASQLVRGGQDPSLRERALLTVLPRAVENRLLTEEGATRLEAAYRFLRALENRLQAQNDRQTHDLPADPVVRERLAFGMNEPGWDALYARLGEHRREVEKEFSRVALDAGDDADDSAAGAAPTWQGAWESSDFAAYLDYQDIPQAEATAAILQSLRDGPLFRRMDEVSRQRLSAALARCIPILQQHAQPADTLQRVSPVIHAICRRSAYLALLYENPAALERLLSLARQSQFLIRLIAAYPILLDELLDSRVIDTPPSRRELEEALDRNLEHVDDNDIEGILEAIRQFQRAAVFRIAVADQFGKLPLMKVSDRLTDTAEIILQFSLDTAWNELVARYGRPMCGDPPDLEEAGFAVIAYGKLGGLELGYGSDLDIAFIHSSHGSHQETDGESSLDNPRFFARLAQRLIHFLGIQTSSGKLYEIDTRLRPSGESGLMVTSMEAFKRYQRKEAWVWEHQALLRSRSVAGERKLRDEFEADRVEVLTRHIKRDGLKAEVLRMRERMRDELSKSRTGEFDLKQDQGGLADIEFLVDYWVLASSDAHPELVEFSDNVRQLEALAAADLVPRERCRELTAIYLRLRERSHLLALNDSGRVVDASDFEFDSAFVAAVWDEVFAE